MSVSLTSLLCRHPELDSGSIENSALPYRRKAQPNRQINPIRVLGVDQTDLPRAVPVFQLLLARNRGLHRAIHLKMHQYINGVFGRVAEGQAATMLRQAFEQIRGYANVERAVVLACKYIYARLLFLFHGLDSAAKWTLKQVQGDVSICKKLFSGSTSDTVTLNLFQGPSGIPAMVSA